MFKKKNFDKRFNTFRTMPPLAHHDPGEFTPEKSEVLKWISEQPELLNYLMETAKRRGLIVYHDGAWIGIDNIKGGEQDG